MKFSFSKFLDYSIRLLPYAKVTAQYVFFSMIFGYLIGAVLLRMRLSKSRVLNLVNRTYLMIFRCVPPIVLLFMIYYGIPAILESNGIRMKEPSTIVYVIVTFSLMVGAFSSEIMRSAYESVDKGQYEAAVSVGLTRFQAFYRIILPQAFPVALPNVGNELVTLIKDGALAYIIGLRDIYGGGLYLNSLDMDIYLLEAYLAMTLIYWPTSILISKGFRELEKLLSLEQRTERKGKKRMGVGNV